VRSRKCFFPFPLLYLVILKEILVKTKKCKKKIRELNWLGCKQFFPVLNSQGKTAAS
jgi:hypothetical protein